jgi:hypothetical protein
VRAHGRSEELRGDSDLLRTYLGGQP